MRKRLHPRLFIFIIVFVPKLSCSPTGKLPYSYLQQYVPLMCGSCSRLLLQAIVKNSATRFRYPGKTALSSQQDTDQDIINRERGVYLPYFRLWSFESSLLQFVRGTHCNLIHLVIFWIIFLSIIFYFFCYFLVGIRLS